MKSDVLFERTNFTGFDMDGELFAFVLLGAITGIGAGLYCKMALAMRSVQVRLLEKFNLTKPSIQRRTFLVVSICLATAFITFPFGIMRISDRVMLNELFRDQDLSFPQWTQFTDSKHTTLFVYFILKLITSVLPCGAPISCGVFGPLFTMGAAVGRFYGETLMEVWSPNQSPATYAVVGAACFAASATQTVSTAVIFFELTGQLSHMVPVMIACIVAYFVSGIITPSIYDILASWAGMNSVCYDFNEHVLSQKAAKDYMGSVPVILTRDTTYEEAMQALVRVCALPAAVFDAMTWKWELRGFLRSTIMGYDTLLLFIYVIRLNVEHQSSYCTFLCFAPQMSDAKNPKVTDRIQELISQVLDIDKKKTAAVEDLSLLKFQPKDSSSTASMQLPNSPMAWLYLMILGSIAGFYGLLFDGWVRSFLRFRRILVEEIGAFSFGGYLIWVMWCVSFGMLSTCCGYYITPMSDGSGIPTMRGLFAGVFQNPDDLLSFRTLVAKTLGTLISSSSGLSVGRGGPFTQIMAMIGYLMGKIPLFRHANFGQANYNFIRADQGLSFPQWRAISDFPQTALMAYILMKFAITLLPCGAPISCGVFGPIFTTGAAIGRLYGEFLMIHWSPTQSPATYAVVGAAGFAGSVTQTVSTAVIVFELTGQLSHMLPVMISCIVAYFVSSMITPSFYDIVAEWAGLKSVSYDVNEYILGQKLAKDHMMPVPAVFTKETTYEEAIQALIEYLVSQVLDIDKRKIMAMEDLSLLNSEEKAESSTTNTVRATKLELGPPFNAFEFTSVPVQSYIPQVNSIPLPMQKHRRLTKIAQVGEEVNLHIVHKVASMSNWTQVYVVSLGKLQGVIHLDASLLALRTEGPSRNEVDAALTSIGLGTPDLWQKLGQELEGKTQLEQPRVSKKVLVKALRMQTEAMRYMVDEFDRLRDKMAEMEREARNTAKHVERVNSKLITVQGQVDDVNTKVYELEVQQNKQAEQLKEIDDVANQVRVNREEIQSIAGSVEKVKETHNDFVLQTEQKLTVIREDHEITKQFAMKIEDRLNEEQKELFLDSDHILHNKLSLAMWMEAVEKDNRRKDEALRDCTEKMIKQGRNVQDMMLETRRTLDDNTCAVEDVQRLLLEKADRTRVDEIIESKYEEICNQLDKALASVLGEEDEFKRASQELQQLVTHLSESKADKKDLLEVKEQVLYDSRVRQQVENLRSFIDIKMNRDDVFSALKTKADKDEMLALLKSLSESMNASIVQAQKSLNYADSAFLTGKQAGHHQHACHSSQKRGGMLPSLDREKCLSCNSQLRDPSTTSNGPISNKNPFQMAPVYGGGFVLPPGSIDKSTMRNRSNSLNSNNSASAPYLSPRTVATMASSGQLAESASEGLVGSGLGTATLATMAHLIFPGYRFLVGVDGRVYQADPEVVAQVHERTRLNPGLKLPQAVAPRKALPLLEDVGGD
ncbi:unnamed protein product [Phytophthora fragariaefolia]|uniref:Unnamed protein product n=1 Tax=Phytophthora fragariaefolia TaxID=1490495 RepID=A0A9W6XSY6_9STRA|nr:unnamed protein product [Phytophthora fragariaefolia]